MRGVWLEAVGQVEAGVGEANHIVHLLILFEPAQGNFHGADGSILIHIPMSS